MIIHAIRKLATRLRDVSPGPLTEDSLLGGWRTDRLILDRRQCVLFARAELALRPVRYQLEAHIWNAPHVLDADPLALPCQLTDRPATVGGNWLWPRDRLLDLVAHPHARRH